MAPVTIPLLVTGTILAAYFDLTSRRIPNWISGAMVVYGIASNAWSAGWQGLFLALGGLTVGGAILLIPHLLWGMGAGDVKLLAAVGCIVGPSAVIGVFILTGLIGGLLAIVVVVVRRSAPDVRNRYVRDLVLDPRLARNSPEQEEGPRFGSIPYGLAVSAGTWAFLGALWMR